MAKNLKLTGLKTFGHNQLRKPSGDLCLIRKGEIFRVDDDVADHLLERHEMLNAEDKRFTFSETTDKAKYDFSTKPAAATVTTAVQVADNTGDGSSAADAAAKVTAPKSQRRARTAG